jgi:Flp pilus assembly protein TadG
MVELALIVAFLGVPLLMGTAEMGILVYESIEVANAAQAASNYGMQSPTYAANTSVLVTSAQAEAPDLGSSLTVTPTLYWACSSAIGGTHYTGSNAQTNAQAACTGSGNAALEFIQVNTSASVTPQIHLPALPSTFTLASQSVKEVE